MWIKGQFHHNTNSVDFLLISLQYSIYDLILIDLFGINLMLKEDFLMTKNNLCRISLSYTNSNAMEILDEPSSNTLMINQLLSFMLLDISFNLVFQKNQMYTWWICSMKKKSKKYYQHILSNKIYYNLIKWKNFWKSFIKWIKKKICNCSLKLILNKNSNFNHWNLFFIN
jgi:hypothetical protein